MPTRRRIPGFFATLRGAMSDIPSSQPVTNELNWVLDFNDRVRRLKAIIDSARPQISQLVAGTLPENLDRAIAAEELRRWREQVNSQCARDAGFAYQAYVRLKLASVRAFGAALIVKLRGASAAIAAVARGRRDHRRLGDPQGHRLRARRLQRTGIRARRRRIECRPGSAICWPSTSNTASGGCIS